MHSHRTEETCGGGTRYVAPGTLIQVEVIGKLPKAFASDPKDRRCASMTPEVQREALAVLAELGTLAPDIRLGQLFAHLGFLGEAHLGRGLGYIEDDELIAIMYRHRAELLARLQGLPNPTLPLAGAATSISGSATTP